jgi:hypothetical protein
MKKLTLMLSIVFFTMTIVAQNIPANQVPTAVKTAFTSKYSGISNATWSLNNNQYAATFSLNGVQHIAHFSDDATWLFTENPVTLNQLPGFVVDEINSRFNPSSTLSYHKETSETGVLYRYHYQMGSQTVQVWFRENGEMVKRNIF